MKEPKKISPVIFLIRVLIYALALPFILWNICFGFIAGYILLVASCGFVPLLRKKTLRHTLLLICTLAFLYLVTIPLTLWQYQVKTKEFYRKIEKGQQLILNEKISIYGLNLILGLVALPVYPEVAKETLYLCIPSKNDVRTFNGDFFLKSRKIRKAIESNESRVSWSAVEFTFGHRESRFALALNPCTLARAFTDTGTVYVATVDVRYSESFEVILIGRPVKISVEEGLFWYLQEINWLYPYKARWVGKGSFSTFPPS